MVVLRDFLLLFGVSALAHYCLAIFSGARFFRRQNKGSDAPSLPSSGAASYALPPVSILKPIAGVNEDTYESIASFCRQTHPCFEVVFGVQKDEASSIAIIERLAREFPDNDIRYVVCDCAIGANPKVNNLATAYREAKYDLLVLADSDVRVGNNYLSDIVRDFADSSAGIVTCLYRTTARGAISIFEALGVSTEFVPNVLVSQQLEGMTFALGATIAMRRTVLESIGGFEAIADYIEDDFQLGRLAFLAGHKIVLSRNIVDHAMGRETWTELFHHQTRWTRGTRYVRPLAYLGLVFTFGTIWSLLFLLLSGESPVSWLVLASVWTARYSMAWLIGVRYMRDEIARRWLFLVPLRDLMSFCFWLYGFMGATIVWRGKRMRLIRGGRLARADRSMVPTLG